MEKAKMFEIYYDSDSNSFLKEMRERTGDLDDYNGSFIFNGDNSDLGYPINKVHIDDEKGKIVFVTMGSANTDEVFDMMRKEYIKFCEKRIQSYNTKLNCISSLS